MNEETYTLSEAKALLAKRECVERGHSITIYEDPDGSPVRCWCERCLRRWNLVEVTTEEAP